MTVPDPTNNISSRSFTIVAVTNLVLIMTGVLATPLYSIYAAKFALSPLNITLIYAAYAVAVIPTFFILGPLGDKLGRKRLLAAGLLVAMVSSFMRRLPS